MQQVRYLVHGGAPLRGTAFVQGAKNAALPLIAASLLAARGHTVLRNVPVIEDVRQAAELARVLGARVEFHEDERTMIIDASQLTAHRLPGEITRRFRGSVLFLPAVFHRCGEVVYEGVGGCNLGTRALDFHYRGFARLGARVEEAGDHMEIKAGGQMAGAALYLDTPSHTGTENLIMAAALTPGRTTIENAALEPEVLDVAAALTRMGAVIHGAGTGRITVEGVNELRGIEHTVMPDRIDAGVLTMAAGITGGRIQLVGANLDHWGVARAKFDQMGMHLAAHEAIVDVTRTGPLHPINVITDTHPGFATDLQSPLVAIATQADGASYVHERLYDGRLGWTEELVKMGARIERQHGETAVIHGRTPLTGAHVTARDLRSGMALVLASLVAEGQTVVAQGHLIDRGHSDLVRRLSNLGAQITREETD